MAEPVSILVVDDERPLVGVITSYLEREDFGVLHAYDGPAAVEAARRERPDLILLDLMLPGLSGLEVCRQVREFSDAYIVMLTARDDEADKVAALTAGADDYVLKPFSPRELVARIQAMLRRPRNSGAPTVIHYGGLTVDLESRGVYVDGRSVVLTRTEYDLLATMANRPRAALSRRELIDAVWGSDWYGDEHVVDVHVGHLRRKLGDVAAEPRFVRTVRGVGYGLASAHR